jgi:hypothetical protein
MLGTKFAIPNIPLNTGLSSQGVTHPQEWFTQSLIGTTLSFQSLHCNHSISCRAVQTFISAFLQPVCAVQKSEVSHVLVRETTVNLYQDNRCFGLVANQASPVCKPVPFRGVRLEFQPAAILSMVSSGFPQSFQENVDIVPWSGHDHFLPDLCLTFTSHRAIRRYIIWDADSTVN